VYGPPLEPEEASFTAWTTGQEAMRVTFHRNTLLPLNDCLDTLQDRIPNLTRSILHGCCECHGMGRLREGTKLAKRKVQT